MGTVQYWYCNIMKAEPNCDLYPDQTKKERLVVIMILCMRLLLSLMLADVALALAPHGMLVHTQQLVASSTRATVPHMGRVVMPGSRLLIIDVRGKVLNPMDLIVSWSSVPMTECRYPVVSFCARAG